MMAHRLSRLDPAANYASSKAVSGPRYAATVETELRQELGLTLGVELQSRNVARAAGEGRRALSFDRSRAQPAPRAGQAAWPTSARAQGGVETTRALRAKASSLPGNLAQSMHALRWIQVWAQPAFGFTPNTARLPGSLGASSARLTASLTMSGHRRGEHLSRAALRAGGATLPAEVAMQQQQTVTRALSLVVPGGLLQGKGGAARGARRPLDGHVALTAEPRAMRRLRVSRGLYLPSDTAMHGIFGSKDVIHSWALPGLNIKIDCIPGLNNHRRVLVRTRGLFWGQCMEVCGRFHHYMPILVRVVHPDAFLV